MAGSVADVWGADAADRLARWAIDVACEPPADIRTYATRIPADTIRKGRAILDDAGLDWRRLKAASQTRPDRRGDYDRRQR